MKNYNSNSMKNDDDKKSADTEEFEMSDDVKHKIIKGSVLIMCLFVVIGSIFLIKDILETKKIMAQASEFSKSIDDSDTEDSDESESKQEIIEEESVSYSCKTEGDTVAKLESIMNNDENENNDENYSKLKSYLSGSASDTLWIISSNKINWQFVTTYKYSKEDIPAMWIAYDETNSVPLGYVTAKWKGSEAKFVDVKLYLNDVGLSINGSIAD